MESENKELRSILVPQTGSEGFFHGWCKEPFFNDSGGYITKTYALIELTNGIVKLIDPTLIRFKFPYETKGEVTSV